MAWVNSNTSEEEILNTVFGWIDFLALGDYEKAGRELGYWDQDGESAAESIRHAIGGYRSPEIFPGITEFKVTDWRIAAGGNLEPVREVIWYKENLPGIAASVSIDLPLNGAWSDLKADFILFERAEHPSQYELKLEEIRSWRQEAREAGSETEQ